MRDELLFVAASLALLVAGTSLARHGEDLARKTRVSATWIGLLLVAAITSLPELITGASSVLVARDADLAAGDVLGSVMFNLLLAGVAIVALRRHATPSNDHRVYRVSAAYVVLMLLAVGVGIVAARVVGADLVASAASALLVALYLLALRHLFRVQAPASEATDVGGGTVSTRRLVGVYAASSLVVVAAASALPWLALQIARSHGLTSSFVGTAFLAASTSLPELVVTLAAIRARAPGLAIGGLVGSNLFDLVLLAVDDLLYADGPLLAAIAPAHAATLALAAIASVALVRALPAARPPRVRWALVLVLCYGAALALASLLGT